MSSDMPHGTSQRSPVLPVVAAALAGAALFAVACTTMVVVRPTGALANAGIAAGVGLGFALIALWLCLVLRIGSIGGGGDGAGGDGRGRDAPDPSSPEPPSDEPDVWPELERELRAYLEAHDRTPVAG